MLILGIESSCDETAAAIVKDGQVVLSSVVASSLAMHQKTGGIIPEVAAREQIKCIIPVIEEALNEAKLKPEDLDFLAVTYGPGLIGSLLVGIETAKTLAYVWNKPIIPVNHLVGHLYANWLESTKTEDGKLITDDGRQVTDDRLQITEDGKQKRENRFSVIGFQNPFSAFSLQSSIISLPKFPLVALVVSGGHTDLVLMKNHNQIEWIGGTRDDAAGECFDKCARLLELGYPGGPAISETAKQFIIHDSSFMIHLPRPMINDNNFDFSFSGLKTAVLREVQNLKNNQPSFAKATEGQAIYQMAYELQEAICEVLVTKTLRAAEKYQVKSLLLAGGVSANTRLRELFQSSIINHLPSLRFFVPPPNLCTDNAVYIAVCAYYHNQTVPWQNITPNPGLTITGL